MCGEDGKGGQTDDNAFTKEEKLLLEEYKQGQDAYYRSEREYSSRENFFIVAEGIIVAAAVQALIKKLFSVAILISLFGIMLSAVWFFMQARSCGYSKAREDRLKEIEGVLSIKKDKFTIFAFERCCEEIRKDKYLKGCHEKISTWKLIKSIPLIFLILWVLISQYSSFYLCKIQCFLCWFGVLLIVMIVSIYILYQRCKDPD